MKLSDNFTREEFEKSMTATRYGIDNRMSHTEIKAAIALCENVLQPAREALGKPIKITSGYRSPDLNKTIGGSRTSQHMKGEAADIELVGGSNWDLLKYIHDNCSYDQLIAEYMIQGDDKAGWVHVSYNHDRNRLQPLRFNGGQYIQGIKF